MSVRPRVLNLGPNYVRDFLGTGITTVPWTETNSRIRKLLTRSVSFQHRLVPSGGALPY